MKRTNYGTPTGIFLSATLAILAGCNVPAAPDYDKLGVSVGNAVGSKIASSSAETNARLDGLTAIASASAANKPLTEAQTAAALATALKANTPAVTTDSTSSTTTAQQAPAVPPSIDELNVISVDGAKARATLKVSKAISGTILGFAWGDGVVSTQSVQFSLIALPETAEHTYTMPGTYRITTALTAPGLKEPVGGPSKEVTMVGTGSVAVSSPSPSPASGGSTTQPTKLTEGQALTRLAAAADRMSWTLSSLLSGVWKKLNGQPLTDAEKAAIQDGVLSGAKKLGIVGSHTLEGAPLTSDLVTYNAASASATINVPAGSGNGRICVLTGSVIDAVLDETVIQGNSVNYFFLSPVGQWRLQWNARIALQNQ